MKSRFAILFTLTLTLLIGYHETTLSFGLLQSYAMERSEETPTRESEEHISVIASRVIQSLVLRQDLKNNITCLFDPAYHKLVTFHSAFFKSSLHILFLSLRN